MSCVPARSHSFQPVPPLTILKVFLFSEGSFKDPYHSKSSFPADPLGTLKTYYFFPVPGPKSLLFERVFSSPSPFYPIAFPFADLAGPEPASPLTFSGILFHFFPIFTTSSPLWPARNTFHIPFLAAPLLFIESRNTPRVFFRNAPPSISSDFRTSRVAYSFLPVFLFFPRGRSMFSPHYCPPPLPQP